jgi:hypothetical protein
MINHMTATHYAGGGTVPAHYYSLHSTVMLCFALLLIPFKDYSTQKIPSGQCHPRLQL